MTVRLCHRISARLLSFLLLVLYLVPVCTRAQENERTDNRHLTSIRDLLEGHQPRDHVQLRGAVTYNGREPIVQDETGAVAVSSTTPLSLAVGDQLEVEGNLRMRRGTPFIDDAHVRTLWPGSTPLPLSITPDEAAEGAYNGMLVTIDGKLIKASSTPTGTLQLSLDSGDQLFTCILESGLVGVHAELNEGEFVRCTGVLSVNQPEHDFEAGSFLVLLRSGNDVHLLAPAPWWTPRRLMLALLLILPVSLLGYRVHLHSVRARLSLVLEERSRIAREIHDTLAQSFAGIALQLQTIEYSMGQQSAATNAHLAMALHMVRRSRAEAHRSIATLRTLHSYRNLAELLNKLLRQLTEPARLNLNVTERGTAPQLTDEVVSEIVRISQEAVANSVAHAQATEVWATVTYTPNAIWLEIQDNGHGFDPATVGSVEAGHFGLTGMRERAAHIQAELTLRSGPQGTSLRLEVPVARPPNRATRLLAMRSVHQHLRTASRFGGRAS